jgi:putative ABC transport system permease protein
MFKHWMTAIKHKLNNLIKKIGFLNNLTSSKNPTGVHKWLKVFYSAWVGISTHKLRSALTILGVVIGVAAVISLMSVGRGTQAKIVSNVESLGSNLLFVSPGTTTSGGVRSAFGSATTLSLDDATIITGVNNVVAVAPVNRANVQIIVGSSNLRASLIGCTIDYQQVMNLQVDAGDFFSQNDYDSGARVCVLGSSAKSTLFTDIDSADVIGQQLRAGNITVQVAGVLKSKGTSGMGASDDSIYVPLTTLRQAFTASRTSTGAFTVSQITVAVSDNKYFTQVKNDITALLQTQHRLSADQDNDFSITSQEDLIKTITAATSSMTMLLIAIAAISLVVGGIGVMNIMLVTVIERTREIGIRKALGARERNIWMQFVVEAAILTFSGGILGVIIGWVVAFLIQQLGNTTTVVSADIIILALSVSIGIGIFFGFYPAWQASKLNPIEALRSE